MQKQVYIIFFYLVLVFPLIVLNFQYSNWLVVGLTGLFFCYWLIQFNQLAKNHFKGELVFRKQKARVQKRFLLLALIPVVGYFINGKFNFLLFFFSASIVVFQIVLRFMIMKQHPIGIVIQDQTLQLNDFRRTKRKLDELKGIKLNNWNGQLELTFHPNKNLLINSKDYSKEDIDRFLMWCTTQHSSELELSDNLKFRLNING